MLNSLFKENYAAEATEVSFASNEFDDYEDYKSPEHDIVCR
jgi:hypothetical protein